MAANELDFLVTFKLNQQSVRNIRTEVDKALSNLTGNIRIAGARGGQVPSGQKTDKLTGLQSDYATATEKAAEAEQRLWKAATKRHDNLVVINRLESESAKLTTEQNAELRRAKSRKGGLTTAFKNAEKEFNDLAVIADALSIRMQYAATGVSELATLSAGDIGKFFDLLNKNVLGAAEVFKLMSTSGSSRTVALGGALDALKIIIAADAENYKKLGIDTESNTKLLSAASNTLVSVIKNAGINIERYSRVPVALPTEKVEVPTFDKDAIKRLDNKLYLMSRGIEDTDSRITVLKGSINKFVRVTESAAQSLGTSAIAEDLRKRVASIERSQQASNVLITAQVELAEELRRQAAYYDAQFSRPIQELSGRTLALSAAFGKAGNVILSTLLPRLSGGDLITAQTLLRDSIITSGYDLKAGIDKFAANLSTIGFNFSTEDLKNALKSAVAVSKIEEQATIALADSERQLADSNRGAASETLKLKAKLVIGDEISALKLQLDQLRFNLRNAGKEFLESGFKADDLESAMAQFERNLRNVGIDFSRMKTLSGFGVDVQSVIEPIMLKIMRDFEVSFLRSASRAGKAIEEEALKGAKMFAQGLALQSREKLIKLDLSKVEDEIRKQFSVLDESQIKDVMLPLQRQVERAKIGDEFIGLREKIKAFAGNLAVTGTSYKQAVKEAGTKFGTVSNEAAQIIRREYTKAASIYVSKIIRGAERQGNIGIIPDRGEIDTAIRTMVNQFGLTGLEARRAIEPFKKRLAKIRFDNIERANQDYVREMARIAVLSGKEGSRFADALSQVSVKLKDELTNKTLDAFTSEFRRAGFDWLKGMQGTASAFKRFEVKVDDVSISLQKNFGFKKNEADLLAAKLKKQVDAVRLEEDAKEFGAQAILSGKTLTQALIDFKNKMKDNGLVTSKAVENLIKAFRKAEREFLKEQIVKGTIDAKKIEQELINKYGRSIPEAKIAAEDVTKKARERRIKAIIEEIDEIQKSRDARVIANTAIKKFLDARIEKERELLRAINDSIKAERLSAKLARQKSKRGQGPGGLQSFGAGDIKSFGQKLDLRGQAKLVGLLKQEKVGLDSVNSSMKSHQGNLAKSNAIVDRLTSSMNASQKAMFQFGFAAASAGERLLAWASPAALIFRVTGALRTATGEVLKMDEELRRVVFFSPKFLDRVASSVNQLTGNINELANEGDVIAGSFDNLGTVMEKSRILTYASAEAHKILRQRAIETGIELAKLTETALVAGRVGRDAFSFEGAAFAQSVEQLVRLEGAQANAADITAKLNSILNQFQLESEDATTIVALLADVSSRSAFSAGELAEGVTRVAGAFSTLQGASPAETMELLAAASNSAQVSVARVGTALRQFSVGVVKGRENVKEFEGLDIVDQGKLKGPLALLEILEKIGEFQGQAAALDFIKEFTDARNAPIILSLSRNVDDLRERLLELADPADRVDYLVRAMRRSFAQNAVQSQSLNAEFNRLQASLEGLVEQSGAVNFLGKLTSMATDLIGALGFVSNAVGGFQNLFMALAGLAIPTLSIITKGFVAGLLTNQKIAESQSKIVTALYETRNAAQAVADARREGLINAKDANAISQEAVSLAGSRRRLLLQLETLEVAINEHKKRGEAGTAKVIQLEKKREIVQTKINNLKIQENALLDKTATKLENVSRLTKFTAGYGNKIKAVLSSALLVTAPQIAELGGELSAKRYGEAFGKEVESTISGALTGAILGSVGGPIGIAIGAAVGGIWSLVDAQNELQRQLALEAKQRQQIEEAVTREINQIARKEALDKKVRGEVSKREQEILAYRVRLQKLDAVINAYGKDSLESKDAIAEKESVLVNLNRSLMQQEEFKKEELKQQLLYEQKIADIKSEQEMLTKANNLAQKAQLALVQQTRNAPLIEARIKAKFDERQLAISKRELISSLETVENEIIRVGVQSGRTAEVKKLEKQRLALQKKLAQSELDILAKRFDAAQAERDASAEVAKNHISAFKSISDLLTESFRSMIDNQYKIVDLIQQESDVFGDIFKTQRDIAELEARSGRLGFRNELDLTSIYKSTIRAAEIFEKGAEKAVQSFEEQLSVVGNFETAEELGKTAAIIQSKLSELGGPLVNVKDNLSLLETFQIGQLNAEKALFEERRTASLRNINLEKEIFKKEISIRREAINVVMAQIDAINDLIEREAQIGKKLITAPDEFIKETKDLFTVQNVFSKVDPKNIERDINRIITASIKRSGGGFAGLQELLRGLEVAEERNIQPVEGVSASELISLLSRTVYDPSAKLQKRALSEQEILIQSIEQLYGGIQESNKNLLKLISEEEEITKLLSNTEQEKKTFDTIKSTLEEQRKTTQATVNNALITKGSFVALAEGMKSFADLIDRRLGVNTATIGEKAIKGSVDNVSRLLGMQLSSSPDFREWRENTEKIRKQIAQLETGIIPDEFKELLAGEIGTKEVELKGESADIRRIRLQQLAKLEELTLLRADIDKLNQLAKPGGAFGQGLYNAALVDLGRLRYSGTGRLANDTLTSFGAGTVFQLTEEDKKAYEEQVKKVRESKDELDNIIREIKNTRAKVTDAFRSEKLKELRELLESTTGSVGENLGSLDNRLTNSAKELANINASSVTNSAEDIFENTMRRIDALGRKMEEELNRQAAQLGNNINTTTTEMIESSEKLSKTTDTVSKNISVNMESAINRFVEGLANVVEKERQIRIEAQQRGIRVTPTQTSDGIIGIIDKLPGKIAETLIARFDRGQDRGGILNIDELKTKLGEEYKNAYNETLARQIVNMEKLLRINTNDKIEKLLIDQLNQAKDQFHIQNGNIEQLKKLEEERRAKEASRFAQRGGLDEFPLIQTQKEDEAKKIGEEAGKKVKESIDPVQTEIQKQTAATTTTNTEVAKLRTEINNLRNELVAKANERQQQAQNIADQQATATLKIDDASSQAFANTFSEAFNNAVLNLSGQLSTTIANNKLQIDMNKLEIELRAEIIKTLQGEEFIEQLAERLSEVGMTDEQIAGLRDTIVQLVDLERERGTSFPATTTTRTITGTR